MSILHSQIAVYGEIDKLVVEARKGLLPNSVLPAVEAMLPNSTGFGEAGWFSELESFFNREGIRNPDAQGRMRFPDLAAATEELIQVPPPAEPPSSASEESGRSEPQQTEPDQKGKRGAGFEQLLSYDSLADPALARAGYGSFLLLKLDRMLGSRSLLSDELRDQLVRVLDVGVASYPRPDNGASSITSFILGELDNVNTREEWTRLTREQVSAAFAANSSPCFGTLQQINGQYCSTVVTNSTAEDLSVTQIERVVEPMNWDKCSKFFCRMIQNTPNRNPDKWSRVREEVGAECDEYRLITDLIFYKVRQSDGSIFLNYDIDPDRSDPGYVEVDNGYLWITPENDTRDPSKMGVRIRTSKQEHVNGLSPCATAALACLMGWADAGKEMLAGTARKLIEFEAHGGKEPGVLKPFHPSSENDPYEQG